MSHVIALPLKKLCTEANLIYFPSKTLAKALSGTQTLIELAIFKFISGTL